MLGAHRWTAKKNLFVVGRGHPRDDFRDVTTDGRPSWRSDRIPDLQVRDGRESKGSGAAVEEGPCLSVTGAPRNVAGPCGLSRLIVGSVLPIHQIRVEEGSMRVWWMLLESLCAAVALHRTQRGD